MGNKSQGPYQHEKAQEEKRSFLGEAAETSAPWDETLKRLEAAEARIAKLEEDIKKCRR